MPEREERGNRGTARDVFLDRIRESLARHHGGSERSTLDDGGIPELPVTPDSPDQATLARRFAREALDAGASVTRARGLDALRTQVVTRIVAESAREVVCGATGLLAEIDLVAALESRGIRVGPSDLASPGASREALRAAAARADVGISEADYGIAESGTIALLHRPGQSRLVSLLPPIHIALLPSANLVPDLGDLFERLGRERGELGRALTFITGPSRTADIEFVLTTGVHGPESLHVVLLDRP